MTYHHDLSGIGTVVSAVSAVVEDPCLPKVSDLVLQLRALEKAGASAPSTGPKPPPSPPTRGIGLCHAVRPLEAVVWVRRRPWVLPLGGMAVIGGLVGLGYLIGKKRR
jgi:hypothetical protein